MANLGRTLAKDEWRTAVRLWRALAPRGQAFGWSHNRGRPFEREKAAWEMDRETARELREDAGPTLLDRGRARAVEMRRAEAASREDNSLVMIAESPSARVRIHGM